MSGLPQRTRSASCLSDLTLDRLRVGELSEASEAEAQRHLAQCSRCESRLASIEADAAEASLPPLSLPETSAAPAPSERRRTWRVAAMTMAAAAAVVLVVWPRGETGIESDPPSTSPSLDDGAIGAEPSSVGTQAKGSGPRLHLYVRREGSVVESSAVDHWRPGDVLGFTYSSTKSLHLAVLGRDALGTVGVYYPAGPSAVQIEPGDDVAFGDGIELDDTLGQEVVYGVFCERAVAVDELREAVERSREPVLPPDCALVTIAADKRAVP